MVKVQLNVRIDKELAEEIDEMVRSGRFQTKTDVLASALKLLIRAQRGEELAERMSRVREGTEGYPSLSETLEEARREEDEGPG
ncbi:MAG TPA: ribbon-helix-helix domain-containing protein [Candidatus Desulfaltia sp.]|nr:ribbon-helix-helix domain-containing protein [Candidatus Desulfaltia sp.]